MSISPARVLPSALSNLDIAGGGRQYEAHGGGLAGIARRVERDIAVDFADGRSRIDLSLVAAIDSHFDIASHRVGSYHTWGVDLDRDITAC